ncbi:MAG: hypothetical protein LBI54_00295 [Lachnospiraceae bacterium]|jgi:hypothetical protein|nr:hypothetical protein [Lachnospiraceae bacterium]
MEVPTALMLKSGEINLHGYEVVRTQFFASARMMSVSLSQNGIRFSSACIRRFAGTEYIELQVHPYNQQIAVVPCSAHHKTKLCWARIHADKISVRTISGKAFIKTLFELFDWDNDMRYRLRGEMIQYDGGMAALFDAQTPEIFASRYDMTMPWMVGFGENYYSYKTSRLPEASISGAFSEYNNEQDLKPTTQKVAANSSRQLIQKMQKEEGRRLDAGSDILC